jgi:hypothetical protein
MSGLYFRNNNTMPAIACYAVGATLAMIGYAKIARRHEQASQSGT